jgi:aspartate aminotransferase
MQLSPAVRSLKPSATIAAAAKAKALKAKGITVYDFTLGEPDFNTPEHIQRAAIEAMQKGHTHYTPSGGIPELKKAICDLYERDYGLKYGPSQVLVSNGAKHSLHNVITAVCGPGDEVIIPAPYWVSYSALVELAGATAVIVPTTEESGWRLAPAALEAAVTPRTKMLLLNSPSNPTGAVYSRSQLEALAEVCVRRNLLVCSDEIYEKLIYTSEPMTSFATLRGGIADKCVIVSGVSKAYAMTGWRIGWTLAPVELTAAMDNLQSQQTSNPCSVSQYAALAALTGSQQCVEEMRIEFARRREYVLQRVRALPHVSMPEPGGAFYAFFNVSRYFGKPFGPGNITVNNSTDFCAALLESEHVATVSGDAFEAPGFVRMSFATSLENLKVGFDRIQKFLGA